jgi:hypothetical protein
MAAKTVCPVSREDFEKLAKPVEIIIDGQKMQGMNREFSTGSLGWNVNNKIILKVGDKDVTVQVGINLTIVGSKDLPKSANSPSAE